MAQATADSLTATATDSEAASGLGIRVRPAVAGRNVTGSRSLSLRVGLGLGVSSALDSETDSRRLRLGGAAHSIKQSPNYRGLSIQVPPLQCYPPGSGRAGVGSYSAA